MSGKPIDEAVLSGRDTAFYLRWALDVLAEHGLEEFSLTIQHVHAEAERHLALTAAQQQGQAVAECHCATCTCAPGMTPAVRFDTSPAAQEGAVRDHLIALGWTPPGAQQPVAEAEADTLLRDLVEAMDAAFISSWQSTAAWQKQLDAAREYLASQQQGGAE